MSSAMRHGDRQRSPSGRWRVGTHFTITGPDRGRGPDRGQGWVPRFWTSYPDDPTSELVRRTDCDIDVDAMYEVKQIEVQMHQPYFVSVKIEVGTVPRREVWTNVAKNGVSWARIRRMQ